MNIYVKDITVCFSSKQTSHPILSTANPHWKKKKKSLLYLLHLFILINLKIVYQNIDYFTNQSYYSFLAPDREADYKKQQTEPAIP